MTSFILSYFNPLPCHSSCMADDLWLVKRIARVVHSHAVSLGETARRWFPAAAAVVCLVFAGLEQFGDCVSRTRRRRIALMSLAGVMMMVAPAAAQVDCGSGFLAFIGYVRTLSIQAVGMFFIVMILAGVVMKGLPVAGTDRAGNAVLGGVVVALVFLVLAVSLIDLADTAAGGAIELDSGCSTGGSGG
jgi:hypothetical protein